MAKTSEKYIQIPGAINLAGLEYTHKMLVLHFLDTARPFQTRSGARIGGKILDAIESAEKAGAAFYVLDFEWWKLLRDVAEGDETELPVMTQQRHNAAGDPVGEPTIAKIGAVHYMPLIDPIDQATNAPPEKLA